MFSAAETGFLRKTRTRRRPEEPRGGTGTSRQQGMLQPEYRATFVLPRKRTPHAAATDVVEPPAAAAANVPTNKPPPSPVAAPAPALVADAEVRAQLATVRTAAVRATLEDERLRGRRFPTISSDTFPKDHAAPEPAKHFSNKLERSQFVPVRAMGRKRIPEAPDGAEKLDLRLLSPRTRSLHLNSRIHNVTHEPELCNALS